MASVRAKFKVDEIRRSMGGTKSTGQKTEQGYPIYEPCEMRTVVMSPVYGKGDPNHENTKFWQASPSGKLELGCVNLAAAEMFELGREYYVDLTPA
jgi:hypothetical protein